MPIEVIHNLEDPRLAEYRWVTQPDTLLRHNYFVAEGRFIVERLLASPRFRTRSVLLTEALCQSIEPSLDPATLKATPIYVAPQETLRALTGIEFHRGCLALGERATDGNIDAFFREREHARARTAAQGDASLIVVLEDIINPDNMGGIFRNAQAFGIDAILLSPRCVDPLYRKAIRVSMGAALHLPFFRLEEWGKIFDLLAAHRFQSVALTPNAAATDIARITHQTVSCHSPAQRFALFLGAEDSGLSEAVLQHAQMQVRIPICAKVDSLNVATASGIAMHHFAKLLANEHIDEVS